MRTIRGIQVNRREDGVISIASTPLAGVYKTYEEISEDEARVIVAEMLPDSVQVAQMQDAEVQRLQAENEALRAKLDALEADFKK